MTLTKADLRDIPQMLALVAEEVKSGVILDRSADEIATNIRSYVLAKEEEKLVGYTALHIHSPHLAEVRSLIVDALQVKQYEVESAETIESAVRQLETSYSH
jgi:amino-acid N-acetyltransferase